MAERFEPPSEAERFPALMLVRSLRKYGRPLPVDFICLRILTGVTRERVDEVLQDLQERGVITLNGENVALVQ